jgi:hypothetical protein
VPFVKKPIKKSIQPIRTERTMLSQRINNENAYLSINNEHNKQPSSHINSKYLIEQPAVEVEDEKIEQVPTPREPLCIIPLKDIEMNI